MVVKRHEIDVGEYRRPLRRTLPRRMFIVVVGAWLFGVPFVVALTLVVVARVGWCIALSVAEDKRRVKTYVEPLAQVMIDHLPKSGLDSTGQQLFSVADEIRNKPTRYVVLPSAYPIAPSDSTSHITLHWPVSLGAGDVKRTSVEDAIADAAKLGDNPVAEWTRDGYRMTLRMWPGEKFELSMGYGIGDLLPYLDSERLLLGFDAKCQPVYYDESIHGPHVKVSGATGAGKTNMFASFVPQWIRQGAQVLILDVKG
jgi:hypothetical protein